MGQKGSFQQPHLHHTTIYHKVFQCIDLTSTLILWAICVSKANSISISNFDFCPDIKFLGKVNFKIFDHTPPVNKKKQKLETNFNVKLLR